MTVKVVLGGQWGDEGKGKIVDFMAEEADVVARATGGNNAGHTVVAGEKIFKFHLLPSGIIHKGKLNICGNGMVIDPKVIVGEIKKLENEGFSITDKNLIISSNAHVITKEQIDKDLAKGGKIGTTGRGIGPCYEDKIGRRGKRMYEFVEEDNEFAKKLKPLVKDTYPILNDVIVSNKNILVEGAQGLMLDIDHGTYPFVTSSNPSAGGVCTGLGIGPTKINEVIAILKAYVTRVGGGPFPTELGTDQETKDEGTWDKIKPDYDKQLDESLKKANDGENYYTGKYMRLTGREYGTTTGRPRRTGWFDGVLARYAVMINGLTSIVLTKLDVLTGLKELKICTAYEVDGKKLVNNPIDSNKFTKAKPIFESMPGWDEDITSVKEFDYLPKNAQDYVKKIEKICGVPISIVSVGPDRDQTIIRFK